MTAISESAGWGPASWWPRSNSDGSRDTNKSPSFSEDWRRWFLLSRRLSNEGRHRKVGYARAATFNGESGDSLRLGIPVDDAPEVCAIIWSASAATEAATVASLTKSRRELGFSMDRTPFGSVYSKLAPGGSAMADGVGGPGVRV